MSQKDIVKELRQVIKGALEEFGTERDIQVGPSVLMLVDKYNMMVWRLEKEEGIELEISIIGLGFLWETFHQRDY